MNIINYVLENASKFPNKNAIIFEEKEYTYLELIKCTSKLCELFEYMKIKEGAHVLLILDNSFEFALSLLALAEIGAVVVPINTSLDYNSIEKAVKSSNVKFVIGLSNILDKIKDDMENLLDSRKWITVGDNVNNSHPFKSIFCNSDFNYELGQKNIDVRNDYILTMTSGSTGNPKPIVFTQETKINRALKSAKEIYNLTENDIIIASSPMYHSLAQRLVLLPLIIGGTSVILKKFTPLIWLQNIEKYKVTFTMLISSHLELLLNKLKQNNFDIGSLHTIVSSSSLLKNEIKKECIEFFNADFHEIYGASEVGTVTNLSPKDSLLKMDSVGQALPYVDIKIINENNTEVKFGERGEIICKSHTSFSRYYENEQATKLSIQNGYFYTGDIGSIDEEGFLYYNGRKKDVINVGGSLVYPKDIEDVINSFDEVLECAVIGVDDIYFGEAVLSVIVPRDINSFNINQIKMECRKKLADYQQPMGYETVKSLPKNGLGKIMKYELIKIFEGYDASSLIRKILNL